MDILKKIKQTGRRNSKYIILKEGNNKRLIASCIMIVFFIAAVSFSRTILPDDRERKSRKAEDMIAFNMLEVTTPNSVYYDKEQNILEFQLCERYLSIKHDFMITYHCTSTEYSSGELPMELIQSDLYIKSDSEVIQYRDTMIQVRVPKDFYYITVSISQADNSTKTFNIDYRDTKQKSIVQKESDYLVNINKSKASLGELEKELTEKETALDQLNSKKDELEAVGNEAELNAVKDSIGILSTEIEQLMTDMEQLKISIEQYEGD